MTLTLYNTLGRKKEAFAPLDPDNVRMYVCGPTVYGPLHLGNGRSIVVYDVLYRLLCHLYGADKVTYVRNLTDVDDKINAAAKERGIPIGKLTAEVERGMRADLQEIGILEAEDISAKIKGRALEAKATDHIPDMIKIIERLISNDAAYVAQGNVLFSVANARAEENAEWYYGVLSKRVQEELEPGARVKVESYKKSPGDFVLWKPADADDDPSSVFDSPWGKGRPGWHIECSAMSTKYLGTDFDIHGGGSDLMFPHHENEIAQSVCAYPGSKFARYWVHNGFLTVNGEKMSKSLGNFITVRELLDKGIKGEVIRYALLKTKYREPLDWSDKLVEDARKELDGLYRKVSEGETEISNGFVGALCDDLNTPKALSLLHRAQGTELKAMGALLGLLQENPEAWFQGASPKEEGIEASISARNAAKKAKNWPEADRIRNELKLQGILLEDRPDGTTDWRRA